MRRSRPRSARRVDVTPRPAFAGRAAAIIEAWGLAKDIERFFADAEERTAGLADADRDALLERLRRGRALLGSVDALDRFRAWKAPEEM